MTLSLIKNTGIGSLYTITESQTAELAKIPDFLTIFTQNGSMPEKYRPQLSNRHIVNLGNGLYQLHNSVIEYSNLCFFWKIIGIFSGTFWNYKRLRRSLSIIIKQVDAILHKIIPSNPLPISSPPKVGVVPTPLAQSFKLPQNTYKPQTYPIIVQPSPAPKPRSAPVLQQPPVSNTIQERIQRKVKLIDAANVLLTEQLQGHRAQIQADPTKLPANIKAALKAEEFFQKTIIKLQIGIDAPLPRWFHSTGGKPVVQPNTLYDSARNIIKQKFLKQTEAFAGPGVYLSTCDEWKDYGPWTFAIDEKELEDTEGYFFPGSGVYSPEYMYLPLWVRVIKNISINMETVAFMVTNEERVDELREKILATTDLKVDVLTREEAKQIYYYLELADKRRECPSKRWKPNTDDPEYELPENMRNSSWPRLQSTKPDTV